MEFSRAVVARAIEGDRPVYGVNTGLRGTRRHRRRRGRPDKLQRAIIVSHAAASGEPLDDRAVRAILLLRARTLAAGLSGVRPTCRAACWSCWTATCSRSSPARARSARPATWPSSPTWPSRSSARAACAPPATPREAVRPRRCWPSTASSRSSSARRRACPWSTAPSRCRPCWPSPSMTPSLLVQAADVACAMSIEALLGTDRPYDERVQVIRPHPGQLDSAANLRALLAGSRPAWPATGRAATPSRTPTACAAPPRCTAPSATSCLRQARHRHRAGRRGRQPGHRAPTARS